MRNSRNRPAQQEDLVRIETAAVRPGGKGGAASVPRQNAYFAGRGDHPVVLPANPIAADRRHTLQQKHVGWRTETLEIGPRWGRLFSRRRSTPANVLAEAPDIEPTRQAPRLIDERQRRHGPGDHRQKGRSSDGDKDRRPAATREGPDHL